MCIRDSNYSALEVAVRRIQQDFDFLMRYLPKLPDDSYAKTETLKILDVYKRQNQYCIKERMQTVTRKEAPL